MITMYLLFRIFDIPLTGHAAEFFCTRNDDLKLPSNAAVSSLPSADSVEKYITQRSAPNGLIPVSAAYMEEHEAEYYSLIDPYHCGNTQAAQKEQTNQLIFYVYRKYLCGFCNHLKPFQAFRELMTAAIKSQKTEIFKVLYKIIKKNSKFILGIREMKQQQFKSDEALTEWIDNLDDYSASAEYITAATRFIRDAYGTNVRLLQFEEQVFPDTVLFPTEEFWKLGSEAIRNEVDIRTRIDYPERFTLQTSPIPCMIAENDIPDLIKERARKQMKRNSTGYKRGVVQINQAGEITDIEFSVCSYYNNLASTNLFVWETAKACEGEVGFIREKLKNSAGDGILSLLRGDLYDSMMGTQCVLLFHNTQYNDFYPNYYNKPDTLWTILIKRSSAVCEKHGSYQFAGVGSFTVRGYDNPVASQIRRGFDIFSSLKSEYAEELFAADDENSHTDITGQKKALAVHILEGKVKTEFLGISASLDTLKTDLVYLFLVEDEHFCNLPFKSNFEDCSGGPYMIPLEEIAALFEGEEIIQAHELAGPLELLKKSRLLQQSGYDVSKYILTKLL